MRCLDLDLDFFLNKNAYSTGRRDVRLGADYRPWPAVKVRGFLEERCGLSRLNPLPGRTVKTHEGVLDFWRVLLDAGRLEAPFEVTHVDAHPDLWVGDGLGRRGDCLYAAPALRRAVGKKPGAHPGDYLTHAIARGWIDKLIWVVPDLHKAPPWDADARAAAGGAGKEVNGAAAAAAAGTMLIPYTVIPWSAYQAGAAFDCLALSLSPDCTPPRSDALVPVIEAYFRPA